MVSLLHRILHVSAGAAWLVAAAIAVAGASGLAAPAAAQPREGRARLSADLAARLQTGDHETTTVIITGSDAQVNELSARHALQVRKRLKTGAVVEVPAYGLAALASDAAVDALSGNTPVFSQMSVTNQAIGADIVHAGDPVAGIPGLTGKGVGIVVIDSGVAHVPQLQGRIVASRDFTDGKGLGEDEHGHGTHVAGIAAASGVNAHDDTRGVAPGAHIISLKVLDAEGKGYADDVIEAIDWAIDHREQYQIGVINLSLGGPVYQSYQDDPVCQAVERAYRAGIVVVASAGNFGTDANGNRQYGGITMPGNSPFAITVGALNTNGTPWRSDDERASYSSMGPTLYDGLIKPDLLAPGSRIRGLIAPGSTLVKEHPELVVGMGRDARVELSGTSMATASVAGAAALLIEARHPHYPEQLRVLLQATSSNVADPQLIETEASALNALGAAMTWRTGEFAAVEVVGESVEPSQRSVCLPTLCGDGDGLMSAGARIIVWSDAKIIVWSDARIIVWSDAQIIVWSDARIIVWSDARIIVWSDAHSINPLNAPIDAD